mmetsp:Transcript_124236/g.397679  ORF Transcript_124236/g.397679 Transcript_124236/m.397679 type:complete len:226 (+) Transcript_124236:325-1002(+)
MLMWDEIVDAEVACEAVLEVGIEHILLAVRVGSEAALCGPSGEGAEGALGRTGREQRRVEHAVLLNAHARQKVDVRRELRQHPLGGAAPKAEVQVGMQHHVEMMGPEGEELEVSGPTIDSLEVVVRDVCVRPEIVPPLPAFATSLSFRVHGPVNVPDEIELCRVVFNDEAEMPQDVQISTGQTAAIDQVVRQTRAHALRRAAQAHGLRDEVRALVVVRGLHQRAV